MKSSIKKIFLFGCSGAALIALLVGFGIVWLIFGAVESINNNMQGGYKVSDGRVNFYKGLSGFGPPQSWEIKEADAATFKVIGDGYAIDKNYAYIDGEIIPQSSGPTFRIIRKPYVADQNHVFYDKALLSNAPDRFEFVKNEQDLATDGENIFYRSKNLFPETIDAQTFQRIGGSNYFRDKNHVYTTEKIVQEADPGTFQAYPEFKGVYAKDKTSVFFDGVKVEGCDPKTHKILDYKTHRDTKGLFVKASKVSEDPEHYRILEAGYSKDSKNVYWNANLLINANPAKFQVLPTTYGTGYGRDDKSIYWCARKFEQADAATFVGLNGSYGKDKNHVWFAGDPNEDPSVVENADLETFEIYNEGGNQARDKNNLFEAGKITRARN